MAGSFKRAPHHARQTVRPEYAAFADALRAAMLKKNLNASEVARRIWGTTKDGRGYDVARNRDRIGHYLAGTSYPETENLQLLADALGLTVEDLAVDRPVVVPLRGRQTAPVQITVLGDQPTHARLQIDSVVPWNLAIEIVAMVQNRLHGSDDDEPTAPTAA